MAEVEDLLARIYGYGASPEASGDGEVYDTRSILNRMPDAAGFTPRLRDWAQSVRATSRPDNLLAQGLDTAANWLDWRPEVGRDTAAPLGVSAMGAPAALLNGLPRSTLFAFIGPTGAQRLASAGIRHADDWGGINRLKAARQDMGWGRSSPAAMEAIWKQYGWTPETTWGTHGTDARLLQPAAALPTPHFDIVESALRPMKTGHHTVHRADGLLPDLVHGLDELMVAEPSLTRTTARLAIDPAMPRGGAGETTSTAMWPGGFRTADAQPTGYTTSGIGARGPTLDIMRDTLLHEIQHGAAIPQGVAPPTMTHQQMNPIKGARAERMARKELDEIRQVLRALEQRQEDATIRPSMLSRDIDEVSRLGERAALLERFLERAPGYVGYLASAPEKVAREGTLRGRATLQQYMEEVPGLVNTYQRGAMGPSFSRENLFPLSAFDPKTARRP